MPKRYCLYVMPMANKDAVARGLTRFNMLGRDLNRNWDKPSDPLLVPENFALETWIRGMIRQGTPPDFAMDLHNDEGGGLHVSGPPIAEPPAARGPHAPLRATLRGTRGSPKALRPGFRTVGTLGEGLLERYGIDACILEFNCNWIAGLKQYPSGERWEQFGRQLREVFFDYFGGKAREPLNKRLRTEGVDK